MLLKFVNKSKTQMKNTTLKESIIYLKLNYETVETARIKILNNCGNVKSSSSRMFFVFYCYYYLLCILILFKNNYI